MAERQSARRQAANGGKRELILRAAREVFASEGLEGASLRAIALRAGYAPAALYFHFESKEAIYAQVLHGSLEALGDHVARAVDEAPSPSDRLRAAALAFFRFYARNPSDLDLGFYLFRGGMRPTGLGHERDEALNAALAAALDPIAQAGLALGASAQEAQHLVVDVFAHAAGLLLLLHTGRIRMFGAAAEERMEAYVEERLARLSQGAT